MCWVLGHAIRIFFYMIAGVEIGFLRASARVVTSMTGALKTRTM